MCNKISNKIKRNFFIINMSIDFLIIILFNIFTKLEIYEGLKYSLSFLGLGIFCSLFFALLFYIIYQFNEIQFQVFTIFFLIGSFIGIIIICINILNYDIIILPIIIPLINVFLLCLYIRIHIWKIDRNKYLEDKMQNKIKKNKNKIVI